MSSTFIHHITSDIRHTYRYKIINKIHEIFKKQKQNIDVFNKSFIA